MPASNDSKRSKIDALREEGALNPAPEKVRDSEIPAGRLLRSARPRAGQVRDAASRLGRKDVGDRCVRRIRRISADVLSSQGGLRGGGDCRVGAQEAWPPWSAQDPERSIGVSSWRGSFRANRSGRASWRSSIREQFGLEVHPRTIERAVRGKKTPRWRRGPPRSRRRQRPASSPSTRRLRAAALGERSCLRRAGAG